MTLRGRARRALRCGFVALASLACSPPLAAELLPLTTWRRADGLAHDHVTDVQLDSRGFLWFSTAAGLSRFDGSGMVSYGPDDGLPPGTVRDLLEVADGRYLVATDSGLLRFDATGSVSPLFSPIETVGLLERRVFTLLADGEAGVWVGADSGLWRLREGWESTAAEAVDLEPAAGAPRALARSAGGNIWVGGTGHVWRIGPGGRERFALPVDAGEVRALLASRGGDLWVGFDDGVGLFEAASPRRFRRFGAAEGFRGQRVRSLFEDSAGDVWVGAVGGLHRWDGESFRRFTIAHGLSDETIQAMAEDRAGNLWLASDLGGVMRLSGDGLTTYTRADGLAHESVRQVTEDALGRALVVGEVGGHLAVREAGSFTALRPRLPRAVLAVTSRTTTHLLRDHRNGWWLATARGLWRYPELEDPEDLSTALPLEVLDSRHGLPHDRVFWTFEDRAGDLWLAVGGPRPALVRWTRAAGELETFGPATGMTVSGAPSAIAEGATGEVWVGWSDGALVRHTDGDPPVVLADLGSEITALVGRSSGGLWLATAADGVWTVATGGASARLGRPGFAVAPALLSARSLVEDAWGRLYVGTVDGIERVDPATGARRHFSTGDGLASLEVISAFRDRRGDLWFGTYGGLSRLTPRPEVVWPPAEVVISALEVDGVPVAIAPLGERTPAPLRLAPGTHQIEIGYFGLAHDPGRPTLYQHRLVGVEEAWSPPGRQREMTFTQLGAGEYRFEVRSVLADGRVGASPAGLAISVPPPWWRRTEALVALVLSMLVLFAVAHRLRVRRLVALAEVRTRIATDLHDDLGADLARISILTEVVRNRTAEDEGRRRLGEIGEVARQLSGRARDIVWAIDPRLDDLASLAVRIREVAGDLLEGSGARWRLRGPEEQPARLALRPELRRDLLLVFQEALHNVVRHAGARQVDLELRVEGREVVGRVRDDGVGFDTTAPPTGRGVDSLAARIAGLGGTLVLDASPERGTDLRFRVPLARPSPIKMRWSRVRSRGRSGSR